MIPDSRAIAASIKRDKFNRNPDGMLPGTEADLTVAFRQAILNVFHKGGGEKWLLKWAKKKPDMFFKIAGRLIPLEVQANLNVSDDFMQLIREGRERAARGVAGYAADAIEDESTVLTVPAKPAYPDKRISQGAGVAASSNHRDVTEADFP